MGAIGGESSHKLSITEMPAHKHIIPWGECSPGGMTSSPWGIIYARGQGAAGGYDMDNNWMYSSPEGADQPHENRPPFYAVYYIMKTT